MQLKSVIGLFQSRTAGSAQRSEKLATNGPLQELSIDELRCVAGGLLGFDGTHNLNTSSPTFGVDGTHN